MTIRAGGAYLDVVPRLSRGFDSDIDNAVSGPMDRVGKKAGGLLGGSLGKAALAATAVVLGKKALDIVTSSLDSARESIAVGKQSEAVIRSTEGAANVTADAVDRLANALARKSGIDDETIASGENVLLTFTKVRNEVGKGNDIFDQGTKAALDMSVAMKTDLKSANIQVGKALNDPIKGITALTRVGVTFTDQQKDQIKTLVQSGRTLDAQKIILAELNREFGGSAEAVATAGGRLSVVIDSIKERIGGALIPVIDRVQDKLADTLPAAADATFAALDRIGDVVSTVVTSVGGVFTAVNPPASLAVELGKLVGLKEDTPAVGALADAFERVSNKASSAVDFAGRVVDKVRSVLQPAVHDATIDVRGLAERGFQYVADAITNSLDLYDQLAVKLRENRDILIPLAAAAVSFVGALMAIKQAQTTIDAVSTAMSALGPILATILAAVGGTAALVVAAVAAVAVAFVVAYLKIKPFHDAVNAVARFIADKAVAAFESVRDVVSSLGDVFSRVASVVGDKLGSFAAAASAAWSGIVDALRPLGQWLNENVVSTVSAAADFLGALFARISDVVEPFVNNVMLLLGQTATVISAMFETVAPVVATVLSGLATLIGDFAAVAMPIFTTAFQVAQFVAETVFGAIRMVIETTLGIIRGLFEIFTGILRGDFSKIWEGMVDLVATPLNAVWTFVTNTFDSFVGLVRDLPGRLAAVASGMWDFLVDSFKVVIDTVISMWNNLHIPSFTIGGWSTPFGDLPSWDTPVINFPDIPPLAKGTRNFIGGLAIVGERGPELVDLPKNSKVIPNSVASRGYTGSGVAGAMSSAQLTKQQLAKVAETAGAAAGGDRVYQLTSGDVTINKQEDVQTAFHRMELMEPAT